MLVVWECELASAKKARETGERLNEAIRQLDQRRVPRA